jgi:malate dehydrogenase (oxaloacetate-decarboxylating)
MYLSAVKALRIKSWSNNMLKLEGTSWQQRYGAEQIFTFRIKATDKPEMLANILSDAAKTGANIGEINIINTEKDAITRDITLFFKNEDQVKSLEKLLTSIDGLTIENISDDTLEIHRRGAIDIRSRVPITTLTDLRMLYTPGVASVCQHIEKNPEDAWPYTGLCDRVAIVTNGTAVLGLGDIGSVPSLPVMEGKAAIFSEFVDISAVPILVDSKDPDTIVETVERIESSFGAIQLEDIAAPECFEIEEKLRKKLNKPVFHDDQHGTATIVLAALINALEQTGKKPEESTVVMLGAGAAGIAISYILLEYGIGDIVVYDSAGAIYKGRNKKMNPWKEKLAEVTNKKGLKGDLAEGFVGRDIFIGVARPNMVSKSMVASMAKNPIVFPLSNPIGEITIEEAVEAGAAVAADGRSINNALAYPAIFRGALDARATEINKKMQVAAASKLASLAPEGQLLPDILDRNVHSQVATAVKKAYTENK